jgi:hypothetical protein
VPAANTYLQGALRMVLPVLLPLTLGGIAYADDADPSGRVARLAHIIGEVSIEPAGLEDWAAADLNRPLTTGDKIWSDADSRVELSIGSAVVRLGSATGFSFLNLDDHTAQMQLSAGTASFHVRTLGENETLEVDTPNSVVALLGPGDYRVEANDAGDSSVVKVSGGTAEITAGGQEFPVHLQQQITLNGTTEVSAVVSALGTPDAFDAWTFERDRRAQVAQVSNYVSPEVIGAEELDQNGTWQATPDDGYVWAPNRVALGWAPYHDGHWIWIAPWGWTWVDAAPWGFAPFHYGRWATFGGRWCWVPGPRSHRPVYAPALVAWVGGAPGTSALSGGGAHVAWFALGPREVYVPAYPVSQTYVRNINISNTTVNNTYITNVYNHNVRDIRYRNRNAPGAITAVSQATFTSAQSVGRNAVRLAPNELAAATASATAPAITPARQSALGAGTAGARAARPPVALQNRQVLARTTPPPAPVPFAAQQQAIQANGGRPIARSELKAGGIYAPATPVRMTAPAAGAESRSGMNRAATGEPAVSLIRPAETRPTFDRPQTVAPVGSGRLIEPRPAAPQREAPPSLRVDRPPSASGQPALEARIRANDIPRPADARRPVAPELNHRVDRTTAPAPALAPLQTMPGAPSPVPARTPLQTTLPAAPPPVPQAPPVQVARPSAPEPKARSGSRADTATHPATRNNN